MSEAEVFYALDGTLRPVKQSLQDAIKALEERGFQLCRRK